MVPRLLLTAATAVALAACGGEKDTAAATNDAAVGPLLRARPRHLVRPGRQPDRLGTRFEIIDLESGETVGRAAPRLETWLLYLD
jgi:hypothetical protein